MNARQLRKQLGIDPGETLTALVELAEKIAPSSPSTAFAPLWLQLPWLEKGGSSDTMRHGTPVTKVWEHERIEGLDHPGVYIRRFGRQRLTEAAPRLVAGQCARRNGSTASRYGA